MSQKTADADSNRKSLSKTLIPGQAEGEIGEHPKGRGRPESRAKLFRELAGYESCGPCS